MTKEARSEGRLIALSGLDIAYWLLHVHAVAQAAIQEVVHEPTDKSA